MTPQEINEQCLPLFKKPRRIIDAKAVTLQRIKNGAGEIIEAGSIVRITKSRRGYGIRNAEGVDIWEVPHGWIRFLINQDDK